MYTEKTSFLGNIKNGTFENCIIEQKDYMMGFLIFIACIAVLVLFVKRSQDKADAERFWAIIEEERQNRDGMENEQKIRDSKDNALALDIQFESIEPTVSPRTVIYYDPWEQHANKVCNSFELINKTVNPDTFFYRCKLAADEAAHIRDIPDIIYDGKTAKEIYYWFHDKEEQIAFQKKFIDRLFDAKKEDSLAYQLFDVGNRITDEALDYYIMKLNGKEFHFCKVLFDINGRKKYTYITKNRSTELYDIITVRVGNHDFSETKVVQVFDVFDAPLTRIDFPLRDLRCVDATLRSVKCPNCGANIQIEVESKKGICAYCQTDFSLL